MTKKDKVLKCLYDKWYDVWSPGFPISERIIKIVTKLDNIQKELSILIKDKLIAVKGINFYIITKKGRHET